jgi:hypothetical protein
MIAIGKNGHCRVPDVRDRLDKPHKDDEIELAIEITSSVTGRNGSERREANAVAAAALLNSGEPVERPKQNSARKKAAKK